MPCTLFISDLHLDAGHPAATQLLLQLLGGRARHADALYILGDLFEAWIGDDDDSLLGKDVCDALKACTASGVPVYIMHGNRDFLLGKDFMARSGATLLEDPAIIDLYGQPVLLTHGDLLCTDDTQYQAFRHQVRDPRWQQDFLARPLAERRRLAAGMRDASHAAKDRKPQAIMDVSVPAVSGMMRRHGVQRLILVDKGTPGYSTIPTGRRSMNSTWTAPLRCAWCWVTGIHPAACWYAHHRAVAWNCLSCPSYSAVAPMVISWYCEGTSNRCCGTLSFVE